MAKTMSERNELVPHGSVHVTGPRIFDAYGRPVYVEPIPEKAGDERMEREAQLAGEWVAANFGGALISW